MKAIYCDFHIHIGRSRGHPVKMAAAPSLTLDGVLNHARTCKGLDVITVIDAVTTHVLQEFADLVAAGRLVKLPDGGYLHENGLVVLLGSEIEVGGPHGGAAHFGAWFGDLDSARDFLDWLSAVQRNPGLSSQRVRVDARTLQAEVKARSGIFTVHHAFTPHKGLYGSCVRRMGEMLDPALVDAVELGLSADTDMADCVRELQDFTFLSNSDAHSLAKIAREYNALSVSRPSFAEVMNALRRRNGCSVAANYGLHVELGKYHRTCCLDCGALWEKGASKCSCGSTKKVAGVYDRLCEIRDTAEPEHPPHRPPYVHQIPLEFIPGLGPKAYARLLAAFGTEMAVLHKATEAELAEVVGADLAHRIAQARSGDVQFLSGGGGRFGKAIF
jgi:uncharacterized protein (TIGR00375 family)